MIELPNFGKERLKGNVLISRAWEMILSDPNKEFGVHRSIVYLGIITTSTCPLFICYFLFIFFLMVGLLQKMINEGTLSSGWRRHLLFVYAGC